MWDLFRSNVCFPGCISVEDQVRDWSQLAIVIKIDRASVPDASHSGWSDRSDANYPCYQAKPHYEWFNVPVFYSNHLNSFHRCRLNDVMHVGHVRELMGCKSPERECCQCASHLHKYQPKARVCPGPDPGFLLSSHETFSELHKLRH